jgi:hypothetical protein
MPMKKEISEKENMQLVIDGKRPAWLPTFDDVAVTTSFTKLSWVPDPKTGNLVDLFGVQITRTPDGPIPANTRTQDFELKDITKWRDIMPKIDLRQIDWEEEARMATSQIKEGQMLNFCPGNVWDQMHFMMGWENALFSLLEEPEASFDCLNAIADFLIEATKCICRFIKPDFIFFFEHVATARGLLMSPGTYRQIIKPVQKKMYDAIIELGALPGMHCDGLIEEIIPDFVEIGVKAIQPFQVFNDINYYKEKYGLIAIGGWDCHGRGNQFDTTEEEARSSVRLAMDSYGPTCRYAFQANGTLPKYPKIIEWIKDEAYNYGLQFYS